jgi:hypothetical protein
VVSAVSVKVQAPVPVHGPDQPVKPESEAAVGRSATREPTGKLALHDAPQSIPGGLERTPPLPVPVRSTVIVAIGPVGPSGPASIIAASGRAASTSAASGARPGGSLQAVTAAARARAATVVRRSEWRTDDASFTSGTPRWRGGGAGAAS